MANLCALAVAREAKAPGNIKAAGCHALGQPMRLYMSVEGHHSIAKAAGLLGIGQDNVRQVGIDPRFQMDAKALVQKIEEDLAGGSIPFCVIATAGTVSTGACDRLEEVAEIAARYGLWFHVDACYGGFAALAPSQR